MTDSTTAVRYPSPPADIAPENVISGIRLPRMEFMHNKTRDCWMACDPATQEGFDALSVDAPFHKTGMASPSMDVAWFARSPGANRDGPMSRMTMDGQTFQHVARVVFMRPIVEGLMEAEVDKYHTVGFGVGREVQILTTANGQDYVEVIDGTPGQALADLPDGWSIRTILLAAPWAVTLPSPVQAYFFFPSFRSFQGPVTDIPA